MKGLWIPAPNLFIFEMDMAWTTNPSGTVRIGATSALWKRRFVFKSIFAI